MEPKNRLSKIFNEIGFREVKPTDALLESWGMTTNRFNQLVKNETKQPMTVGEAHFIRTWLNKNFKGNNTFLFDADIQAHKAGNSQLQLIT